MSYARVMPLPPPPRPPRVPAPLRGLGTVMDANILTSAWYLPLVERVDQNSGARSYEWAPYKYLSNWDALNYNGSFTSYTASTRQDAILYQWDDNSQQWQKTMVGSSV